MNYVVLGICLVVALLVIALLAWALGEFDALPPDKVDDGSDENQGDC